jgi:nucleotide-binding universal stress UspA family protein
MTRISSSTRASASASAWTPRRILCAIDGSRGSSEAVRQSIALAPAGSALTFAAVTWTAGFGPTAVATVSPKRAQRALAEAVRAAEGAGCDADRRLLKREDAGEAILELAAECDLLCIGTSRHSRLGGIALGRVATRAAHAAPCEVLVARPAAGPTSFPHHLLLAFDGSPASVRAGRVATALAQRHGSEVTVVAAGRSDASRRHALAEFSAAFTELIGPEPVIVLAGAGAGDGIVETAQSLGVELVVVGSRRLSGVHALASVSERVAHAAPCSVLIARGP